MTKLNDLLKKQNKLNINKLKMCGYLSDYIIDKSLETEDFNFISNTLFDYFKDKDIGYLLTKFDESGLKDKIDDNIELSLNEWNKIHEEIKLERNNQTNVIKDKEDHLQELIKKRKKDEDK